MRTKTWISLAVAAMAVPLVGHAQSFSAFDPQNMFGNPFASSTGTTPTLSGNQSSLAPGLSLNLTQPPVVTTPGLPPSALGTSLAPSLGTSLDPSSLSPGIGGLPTMTTPGLPPAPFFLATPPIGTSTSPTIGTSLSPTIGTSLSPTIGIPSPDPLLQTTPSLGSGASTVSGSSATSAGNPAALGSGAPSATSAPAFNPDALCRADDLTCRE